MTCCVCLLFSDAETGVHKLTVGKEQEMTLTAIVYNRGEEAHWAMLNILLPPNLDYVGGSTQVQYLVSSTFLYMFLFLLKYKKFKSSLEIG